MGKEEMSVRKIAFFIILIIFLNLSISIEAKEKEEILFSYKKILDDEFNLKVGAVIPVTIGQAIETDGTFTGDGKYFFFTSDESGNFDIYLRYLSDITTVRITEHAAKDASPAVSPDGRYLAFVSQRDDPEGDIFVIKLDPGDIIDQAKSSGSDIIGLDSSAKNLTLYRDPAAKMIKIIRDASPCWSPDGKSIAFSSARDGLENIYVMDRNSKNLAQITKKGGMYPRFSNDGKKIIFVSYRENKDGDLYAVNIETLSETRITAAPGIKLNPGFMGNDNEIIYTLIDRDTNNDKKIDFRDNSVLYYKNFSIELEHQLTLYSESSFSPQWSPVYDGIIIYSNQIGENINVNIVPEYGVIPKKQNARLQFDLAEKYNKEYDDTERYLLCLERVFQFFGSRDDMDSRIYVSRALSEAVKTHISLRNKKEAARIQSLLAKMSKEELDYRSITGRYLDDLLNEKPGDRVIKEAILRLRQDDKNDKSEKNKSLLPFLMEDMGDEYLRLKNPADAVKAYTAIINEYPDYKRLMYIHYKSAGLTYKSLQAELSSSYLQVLSSNFLYLQIDAAKDILRIFDEESNLNKRIEIAGGMLKKYKEVQSAPELFLYIIGKTYLEKGDLTNAKSNLAEGLKLSKRLTYMYYKINVLLGELAEREKDYLDMERFLSAGANRYERRYKEARHRDVLQKLIRYYEEYGERAETTGDHRKAVELYEGYVNLLRYLHTRKLFPGVYSEYAPRSHILYIDAYSEWKRNDYDELLKLENEYNAKENRLARARIALDKAHIYGLAYIYAKMGASAKKKALRVDTAIFKDELDGKLSDFNKAVDQIEWALFMDDTFIDPELLKGWIYQYVDLKRQEDKESGGKNAGLFKKYFPEYLWEKNIPAYEKALEINDEREYPEREGNLHLNLANTYFLLSNYPRAFAHFKEAKKYKKNFASRIEEALFYYHLGYCYWQNDELAQAREEMAKAALIYESLASGNFRRYKYQIYYLYRFFALFDRIEKKYDKAISWYNRILEFSNKYNIKTDRARYLQEIAYCHKELGESKAALAYLDMAEDQLKKKQIDQVEYNLNISFLGLVSLNLWDLGPDTFVIGDNQIYTELDTIQERLLNTSLKEEIFYNNGDIHNAIEAMHKKLNILKGLKNKIYNETRIKTLNNIGFYYFRLRDYDRAMDFFKQALDFAAAKDVNDLEGIFVSVLNTANLYSFMIENSINSIKEPVKTIDSLIRQIEEYRESYEKKRYDEEIKKLGDTAKSHGRGIREEENRAIRERVSEEAGEKYYSLDIAIGELEYQKAGLLKREGLSKDVLETKDAPDKAYGIYVYNKNIFYLYSDAINRFESAAVKAEAKESKRLLVKLLLNLAASQEKIGLLNESYNAYTSAMKYASMYEYSDILWIVYYKTADFLAQHGRNIEGDNYLTAAQEYYKNAAGIIEEFPYLYKGETPRVKSLYNNYAKLMISLKSPERALEISERGYEILRIMLTGLTSPKFYLEADNDTFIDYVKRIREIERIKQNISGLLESGGPADSADVLILKENLKINGIALKDFVSNTKKSKSLLASFISLQEELPMYDNAVIYKFIESSKSLYAWKIYQDKVLFKELTGSSGKDLLLESVSNFMRDGYTDKHRFVILNDASKRFFLDAGQDTKHEFPPFMYIPCIERAKYYMSANNISIDKSSILVDEKAELTPAILFGKRLEPALLISRLERYDADFISQIIESSLYAGVKTLYLYNEESRQDTAKLTAGVSLGSFDNVAGEHKNILAIGFKGYSREEREKIAYNFKEQEYGKFLESLAAGDINSAELHLNKWQEIKGSQGDDAKYLLDMSELEFLKEDFTSSMSYIDRAIASIDNSSDLYLKAVSNKIFLLLYNGDFTAAGDMLQKNLSYKNFNNSADCLIYRSIVNLIREEAMPAIGDYKKMISGDSILPKNKLKLLFAEYLNLFENPGLTGAVLEDWACDYNAGERERLKAALLTGKADFITQRSKESFALMNSADIGSLRTNTLLQVAKDGKYDRISIYPVYFALNNFIKKMRPDIAANLIYELNIAGIGKNALWLDAVPLIALMIRIYEAEERYNDALNSVKEINNLLKAFHLSALLKGFQYKEGILLSKLEKYNDSYNSALAGIALAKTEEDLYIKYQLLLTEEALYLGKTEDAISRASEIESILNRTSKKEYEYVLYLLKSRIELLHILKNKKASDAEWERVEKLILSALETLDSSPGIIARFNRVDLVSEALDFLISFKMSRNDAAGSLLFAEVKKQMLLRSKYPDLIASSSAELPEDVLRRFRAINDKKESREFAGLFKRYPALQVCAFAKILPLDLFQEQLKDNSVALYLVANVKDILGWVISKDSIKTLRIKDGYERANEIVREYRDNLAFMKNTAMLSKELYNLFKPFEKYYKGKSDIIIITDNALESIPFEIIGERDMLEESFSIVYLSSILSSFRSYKPDKNFVVNLINTNNKKLIYELESVSIKESGIPFAYSDRIKSGIAHLNSEILFDSFNKRIYINGKLYKDIVRGARTIYIPDYNPTNIGFNEFTIINSLNGIKEVIINNAGVHDLNNAFFVNIFYNRLNKGEGLLNSFLQAKYSLRKDKRFSYPAYWAGIRLYLNGI